jgi:hypothetical protein
VKYLKIVSKKKCLINRFESVFNLKSGLVEQHPLAPTAPSTRHSLMNLPIFFWENLRRQQSGVRANQFGSKLCRSFLSIQ